MERRIPSLGEYLKRARESSQLTLREVEKQTGVSNAYISQLESGKVAQPSPNILHKLCTLYGASYAEAFQLSGYPSPRVARPSNGNAPLQRLGQVTNQEAEELEKYLAFIRSQGK